MSNIVVPDGTFRMTTVDLTADTEYQEFVATDGLWVTDENQVSANGTSKVLFSGYRDFINGANIINYNVYYTDFQSYGNTSGVTRFSYNNQWGQTVSANKEGNIVALGQALGNLGTNNNARILASSDDWATFDIDITIALSDFGGSYPSVGPLVSPDGNVVLVPNTPRIFSLWYFNGTTYVDSGESWSFGSVSIKDWDFALDNPRRFVVNVTSNKYVFDFDYDQGSGINNLTIVGRKYNTADFTVRARITNDGQYLYAYEGDENFYFIEAEGVDTSNTVWRNFGDTDYSGGTGITAFDLSYVMSSDGQVSVCYRDNSDNTWVVKTVTGDYSSLVLPTQEYTTIAEADLPWGSGYDYHVQLNKHNELLVFGKQGTAGRYTRIKI